MRFTFPVFLSFYFNAVKVYGQFSELSFDRILQGFLGNAIGGLLNGEGFSSAQRPGCLAKLAQSSFISAIITNIVENSINDELRRCHLEVDQQQTSTWMNLIPELLYQQKPTGERIAGSIFGAMTKSCELEAKREFCRQLQLELVNPNCNICSLIVMAFRPSQIQKCACDILNFGNLQNVANSVQGCIGTSTASGVLQQQFGGLIPIPGC